MKCIVLAVALVAAVAGAGARADDTDPKKAAEVYVKVEAKGKLATGIMAIGGETTGVQLRAGAVTLELDLDKKLRGDADKLNGKVVIVTGTLYVKPGVTRGARTIIKVATLKEAK
jgi:hypothetical protein